MSDSGEDQGSDGEQSQQKMHEPKNEGYYDIKAVRPDDDDEGQNEFGEGDDSDEDDIDSSDEDEEENEEEYEKVRKGFIVDDDEEGNEEEDTLQDGTKVRRKKNRNKRRRESDKNGETAPPARDVDEQLDEDDLDLLMENAGVSVSRPQAQHKFKRLKRARQEEEQASPSRRRGLEAMFSEESSSEEEQAPGMGGPRRGGPRQDEFAGFIEDDEFSEEEGGPPAVGVADTGRAKRVVDIPGVDEEALGEIYEVFGDGEEYGWALEAEEQEAAGELETGPAVSSLQDIFEPSELSERLLTDEDNVIRVTDIPERFQLARKTFKSYALSDVEYAEEETWLVETLLAYGSPILARRPDLYDAYRKTVTKALSLLVRENLEVPFVWQHRRDFLLYAPVHNSEDEENGNNSDASTQVEILLEPDDLWKILRLDLSFHSLLEKKRSIAKSYTALEIRDELFEENLARAKRVSDFQDCLDYLHFRYSSQLRDLVETQQNGSDGIQQKRTHNRFGYFERIRKGRVYDLVRAFGITSGQFAENFAAEKALHFPEDATELPLVLAEEYAGEDVIDGDNSSYETPEAALSDAKKMLAEEIIFNPTVRLTFRNNIMWKYSRINVHCTQKGKIKIDETHPYYSFKYARNRQFPEMMQNPDFYLNMLQAESQGLVHVSIDLVKFDDFFANCLSNYFSSDGSSDVTEAWNKERSDVLKSALKRLAENTAKIIKEELKHECEQILGLNVRRAMSVKLNQAPYKPQGFELGTVARTLTITCGPEDKFGGFAYCVYLDDDSRVLEHMRLPNRRDEQFGAVLTELIKRRQPDVIGIAGMTTATARLFNDVEELVRNENITVNSDEDQEYPLEVIWVNDEVARLYQNSARAQLEYPDLPSIGRYCAGLGRYLQSPLLEYASLGTDVASIQILKDQQLLSQDTLSHALESSFVDVINTVGVDINDAVRDATVANLLPFIAGLGPRKASGLVKAIASQGGTLASREELVTNSLTGKTIFMNCASFLKITAQKDYKTEDSDPLDGTRIHPEDYELAKKMAADALELDEEDLIDTEKGEGVIAQLMNDDLEKLNELILELYADELEKKYHQKKRATLEMIKEELQRPYHELRLPLHVLDVEEVFEMLTGETSETIKPGAVVPVNICKVADRYVNVNLACGIEGNITASEMTSRNDVLHPSSLFYVNQAVRARILDVDYSTFKAELTTKEEQVQEALKPQVAVDRDPELWDEYAEDLDRNQRAVKQEAETRSARVIKHPLFKPFNSAQAIEYLAPLQRGDLVIRPSSRGLDHIAITWKVNDGIYQHLDVVEMEKENDYSIGRQLIVEGVRYSDLDELIVVHIKSMAKKVDEMTLHEKFHDGSRVDMEKWLDTYCEANPKRSNYAFCFDYKNAGYFLLCFKAGLHSRVECWHVKVIPNGYRLQNTEYGDVTMLCNGFKTIYSRLRQQKLSAQEHAPRRY